MSAAMVHVSHACKHMNMGRERTSLTLELMSMFLSFQINFNLVIAAMVWAILESTSGLDSPIRYSSSQIFKATYSLRFVVVYRNVSADAMVLFVINWVFSELIWMPYAVEASSG